MDSNNPMKKNIHKIVYVMFENRSFDNLLGWLYDGQANPEVNNIPSGPKVRFKGLTPEIQEIFAQPIEYKLEWWKDGEKPIVRGVEGNHFPNFTPIVDPEEKFNNITYQVYGKTDATGTPTMKGFLQNYYDHRGGDIDVELEILGTYDFKQLPILNTLASQYGVSDEWFCSIPSQTSINRAFSICGNSVGLLKKEDIQKTAMVNNHFWNELLLPASFTETTIWEVLTDNGYDKDDDWKIYYSSKYLHGHLDYDFSYSYYLFASLRDVLKRPDMKNKYQKIDQFYADAKAGTLPRFSYIEPVYTTDVLGPIGLQGNDYHPPGNVQWGESFLRQLYEALAASPDWDNLLFIVAWDEHGGTFDHEFPPCTAVNPGITKKHEKDFQFNRFGVRVPMLFISPWVQKNTVIRSADVDIPFDHTSWLATLLDWFCLDPALLGNRTKVAPKFDSVISDTARGKAVLPPLAKNRSGKGLQDKKLTLRKTAEITRVMASHDPTVDELDLLRKALKKCKNESELERYFKKWMKRRDRKK